MRELIPVCSLGYVNSLLVRETASLLRLPSTMTNSVDFKGSAVAVTGLMDEVRRHVVYLYVDLKTLGRACLIDDLAKRCCLTVPHKVKHVLRDNPAFR